MTNIKDTKTDFKRSIVRYDIDEYMQIYIKSSVYFQA